MQAKPQLRYLVSLSVPLSNQNTRQKPEPNKVTIYADGFEIKEDGSLVFYQVSNKENKLVKISVLAYPNGKWETCLLLNSQGNFAAFCTQSSFSNTALGSISSSVPTHSASSQDNSSLAPWEDSYDNSAQTSPTPTQYGQSMPSEYIDTGANNGINNNLNIPGMPSVVDMRKVKADVIEQEIKRFLQENADSDSDFSVSSFIRFASPSARAQKITLTESDVQWTLVSLLRRGKITARKFLPLETRNLLDMYLPAVLKRHWSGAQSKLASILEILQERDETKNITQLDLAAWLAANHYFK